MTKAVYTVFVMVPFLTVVLGGQFTLAQGWCGGAQQSAMTFFIVGETPPMLCKL
jgi:hypothetical protein